MKKLLSILLIGAILYLIIDHIKSLANSVTQIDQISNGLSSFKNELKNAKGVSFIANSPEEIKIHFETQNILAPIMVHKGWQDYDYLLYIEDFNYPKNESVPVDFFELVKRTSDDRFHFNLYERK